MKGISSLVLAGLAASAAPVAAQGPPPAQTVAPAPTAASPQTAAPPQAVAPPPAPSARQQRELRYQVSQMERMLEGAVEHGATIIRERLQPALPMLISENAHVRGFRLDGYGVFFDIEVPGLQSALTWSLRTLDQNDLGLQSAIEYVKSHINAAGDENLEQALRRIELQVAPASVSSPTLPAPALAPAAARTATGALAATAADQPSPVADLVLSDPDDAFHREIKEQIMKAMLDYSGPLEIRADEWLTVAARRHDERPTIAPADTDARTVVIRVRGGDLAAYRSGQVSREDALKKMDVREF